MMDEILSNQSMDRVAKIDKLEAILSAVTLLPSDQVGFVGFIFFNHLCFNFWGLFFLDYYFKFYA